MCSSDLCFELFRSTGTCLGYSDDLGFDVIVRRPCLLYRYISLIYVDSDSVIWRTKLLKCKIDSGNLMF